jgi:prepilin-type processing-associated H-X9-DG protein
MALDAILKLSMKGVPGEGHDTFEFKPELTSEPTAPEPDIAIYNGFEVVNTTSLDDGGGDDSNIGGFIIGGSTNGLAVDPTNPNTEVDGRDFLIWQRGNATPGPDDNVDDGLLLPAVQTDEKSHLEWPIGPIPEDHDVSFVFQPQTLQGRHGDTDGSDWLIWQTGNDASGHTGGINAVFCDGSVRTVSDDGARVPPHTPEWTDFNSSDPGLLLPAVQGLLLPAVQYDFDLT